MHLFACRARHLAASGVLFALLATGANASESQYTLELQTGAGIVSAGEGSWGPMVHAHARFSAWHTIGLGAYIGAYWPSDQYRLVVPLCGRANLSLPFWKSFEPMLSFGAGAYWYRLESDSQMVPGAHVALALLFPHRRHGFGVEAAVHLTGDPYLYESAGLITFAGTYLFR